MYQNWKILAIIPARGGSKSVPRKNLRLLGGKPLIAHSVIAAQKASYIDRVVVSTDDEEIARVAKTYGAQVPFLRPKELAQDLTRDEPVVEHCLNWLREHACYEPDIIVYLRPTGPIRRPGEIDASIALLASNPDADSARTVNEPARSPYKMWKIVGKFMEPFATVDGLPEAHHAPRQMLPKVYQTSPNVGVVWTRSFKRHKSLIGKKVLPLILEEPVVDIDTELDLALAELVIQQYGLTI